MATLNSNSLTLKDLAEQPENKESKDIINLLTQYNPVLEDAPAIPCNKGSYHLTTVLTGLPTPTWGKLYKGIPATKSKKQTVKDTTGFLEGASEVDERLIEDFEKAEDKASMRMTEALAHLEAMAQEGATALFYHDTDTDPERPMGLAPRFNDLSAENGGQIISGGGAGSDNTSMWMITWDPKTCHLIYPNKGTVGIQRRDRGAVNKTDSNGDTYHVLREEFTWHMGLSLRDWRYVTRGCNIDVSDLTVDASAGANLFNVLTEMYYKHHGRRMSMGKTCIYVNTTIMKFLDYQARNNNDKLQLTYAQNSVDQQEVLTYRGIPIKECDAILDTEETVS